MSPIGKSAMGVKREERRFREIDNHIIFRILVYLLTSVLICVLSDHIGVNGCGIPGSFGDTSKDQTIDVGFPFTINCTLHVKNIDSLKSRGLVSASSQHIYFSVKGERIPQSKIRIIDNVTIEYKVEESSFNDTGRYACYIDKDYHNDSKPTFVCMTYVKVASAPYDIPEENFRCLNRGFRRIECSWDLPDYKIPTKASLHLLLDHGSFIYSKCHVKINNSACAFDSNHSPPYLWLNQYQRFQLETENALGTHVQEFKIDSFENVIADPPSNATVVDVEPTRVHLRWKLPSRAFPDPERLFLLCQLKLSDQRGNTFVLTTTNDSIVIGDLTPYTRYEVEIRSFISVTTKSHLGSHPLIIQFKTDPDIPYSSPPLEPGAYESIMFPYGLRDVIFHFSPLKEEEYNDEHFDYVVTVKSSQQNEKQESILGKEANHLRLFGLSRNITYEISLRSRNSRGFGNRSSLIVPSDTFDLPRVHDVFVINENSNHYTIAWLTSPQSIPSASPSQPSDSEFQVFSCKINPPATHCLTSLELIGSIKQSLSFPTVLAPDTSYNFAVASVRGNISAGLTWASCVEKTDKTHQKDRFKKLEVITQTAHSFLVSWELDCRALYSFIQGYEVHYCKFDGQECTDHGKVSHLNATIKEVVVNGLDSNSLYGLKVRAITKQGQHLESVRKTGQTKLDNALVISIGLLIILIIVSILIGLYTAFLWSMKKRKEHKVVKDAVNKNWVPKLPSKLKGDPGILLNTMCHGDNQLTNQYENKEYMANGNGPKSIRPLQIGSIIAEIMENDSKNLSETESPYVEDTTGSTILTTETNNQRNGLIYKKGIQNLFNSSDSGYETKNNSDEYCPAESLASNGVDSRDEDNPYVCIDDGSSSMGSLEEPDENYILDNPAGSIKDSSEKDYVASSETPYVIV
ncbi:cytokine receptor domeless [Brevipalpus obovatus]|uniref:cytokine receptor domeless n=1 Tax=Brevipalpus obovatus TaxID=246614 RepID=UPI003D9F6C72